MFFQPEGVSIEISKDLILWPYFIASEISRMSNSIFSSNLISIKFELFHRVSGLKTKKLF